MVNLKNPPLDFAGTRQLFSALKARGIYYQYATDVPDATRKLAISLGDVGIVEPPVLENIVAQTYRITGEYLWIARIYSSLFWVIGALGLFLLIREIAAISAAIAANPAAPTQLCCFPAAALHAPTPKPQPAQTPRPAPFPWNLRAPMPPAQPWLCFTT